MIECRPIRMDESGAYLNLLCAVFDLDASRASQVFYSEPFFGMTRKWGLFLDGDLVSILSLTPLEFGWGHAVGVAGVATDARSRGRGMGQRLLEAALADEPSAILFAYRPTLYARLGFQVIDEVVNGELLCSSDQPELEIMDAPSIQAAYEDWASRDPARLRRDERRWDAWRWIYRPCEAFSGGYICSEPMLVREAILAEPASAWPVMPGSRWIGLRSLTQALQVPAVKLQHELLLMGRGFPSAPQMFMTDQF